MSERYAAESAPAARRPRTWLVAGTAAAAVVLAIVGVTGGWLLAGPGPDRWGSDSGAGVPPASAVTPTPTADGSRPAAPSPSRSVPPPGAGQIRVPDLAGVDFVRARQRLREVRLGWQLVFAEHGTARTVARTDPPAGTTVRRGTTVTVYVRGAAPPATVPGVVGLTCRRAGSLVVEHGLYPQYPTGQAGRVVKQDPEPPGELRWNNRVRLFCAVGEPTPSPTSRPE